MATNVYAWPVDEITVPAFIVGFPEELNLTTTFQRGSDELVLPCWFVVGAAQSSTPDVRNALSAELANGTISDAIEGAFAWGSTNVDRAHISRITVGAVDYVAIKWDLAVITNGPMNLATIMDAIAAAVTSAGL